MDEGLMNQLFWGSFLDFTKGGMDDRVARGARVKC